MVTRALISRAFFPRSLPLTATTALTAAPLLRCRAYTRAAMAADKFTAPYGSWSSPISADAVAGGEKRLGGMAVAGDGHLLWVESRPEESGRAVLVAEPEEPDDKPRDVIPPEFAVRTLAQEYGGGAFSIFKNMVIFSNYKDQRLYKQIIGEKGPVPLTPDYGGCLVRYADGVVDARFNRYITVMEDYRESSLNPVSTISSIDIDSEDGCEPELLITGSDFYAFPRIDPSGKRIAWIQWCHPSMPWDKTQLWVGYFSEKGDLRRRICIAGDDPDMLESPTEPKWSPNGELYFVTDRKSGFWNIYKWVESNNDVMAIYNLDAEFTRPLWVFGISSFDFLRNDGDDDTIVCSYRQRGKSHLGILNCAESSFSVLDIPFTDISNIVSWNHGLFVEGASATHPLSLAKVTLDESNSKAAAFAIIWSSSPESVKYASCFSLPEVIEFPTETPGKYAYAYFYPPTNDKYQACTDEKPPLLLKSHGGPTAESRGILDLNIQYWTSRGWAFVDVNYGGSTGYGRDYRERLLGTWGVTDVNDCCSCAKYLVDSGKVDGNRLCITGRSAGGFTTLAALAFRDTFKAGASLYGVADLSSMRAETHKFESCYLDNLIGDNTAYFERSPINFIEKFTCPVIFFQGLDDKVVPPNQARAIYQALKRKGIPVALVEFEGEQHGFRKAENIKFTLEQQMVFFARLVGHFEVADSVSPIKIDNFD